MTWWDLSTKSRNVICQGRVVEILEKIELVRLYGNIQSWIIIQSTSFFVT